MLPKLRSRAATVKNATLPPSAEQYTTSFRRAPAQPPPPPTPPAGTARWVGIMVGSEPRGWWSGVQSPPSDATKGRARVRSAGVGTGNMSGVSPHLERVLALHLAAEGFMKPVLDLDPRCRGVNPSGAAERPWPRRQRCALHSSWARAGAVATSAAFLRSLDASAGRPSRIVVWVSVLL